MDNLRGLLGIRRIDRVPIPRISVLCGVENGLDERGLMKASSGSTAMWRGWRRIGLPREFNYESVLVVVQWVGHGREGMIPQRSV